jgi:hypothetical protein
MAFGYAHRVGYVEPDLTGKGFGSPEMMKSMQEMFSAFDDDLTRVLIPFIDTQRTSAPLPTAIIAPLPGFRWAECRPSRSPSTIWIPSVTSADSLAPAG